MTMPNQPCKTTETQEAITSLHTELYSLLTEIVDVIDKRIDQLLTPIRGEMTALKCEINIAISTVKATTNELTDFECSACIAADTSSKLEQEVGPEPK